MSLLRGYELASKISIYGLFERTGQFSLVRTAACQVCMEAHNLYSIQTSPGEAPVNVPLGSHVRLSDGISQVDITIGQSCLPQPFQNTVKMLASFLGLRAVSDHQIFDSLDHLITSLQFSIPGTFFGWDETDMTDHELYAIELGHLMKFNFQSEGESGLIDVVVEFEESGYIESNYQGVKAGRHGIEITISGQELNRLEAARSLFQDALDDYARLLGPAII